jgi:hypothetical protein
MDDMRMTRLRFIFLLGALACSLSGQVPLGATKKEVIDQLGWPHGSSGTAERAVLNYPDFSILLVDGRVEKLEFKPKDGRLPNAYAPPPSRQQPAPRRRQATNPSAARLATNA